MARMVMQGTRKTDPFGAKDLTPAQEQQVQRARVARQMANVGGEFGVQTAGGALDAVLNAVQGVGELADIALPGDPGIGDALGRGRAFVSERLVGQPETMAGMAGRGVGYLGGTLATYLMPSAAAARAAGAAGGTSRALNFLANPIGRAGLTAGGNVNRAGQLASGALMTSPVNVAMGLSPDNTAEGFVQLGQMMEGKEGRLAQAAQALGAAAEPFAKSPAGRVAFEFLADFAPNAAILGATGALARTREGLTYVQAVRAAREGNIGETIKLTRQLQQMQEAGSVSMAGRGAAAADEMPTIPRKPAQETIDRAAFTSKPNRALEAGNDAEVTRLLERQQQLRPLDEQLEDALDRQANARGKKAQRRADVEVDRVLTLMDQQALPVQGPQQWRGPQRFAADPEQMTIAEELANIGSRTSSLLNAPGVRAALARGAAGAAVGATLPEEERNKVAAGVGLGLLGAVGPRRFMQGVEGLQPGLSTQEVTPDFISSLYSRVERQIEKAPFAKGTGQQWAAQLAKNTAKGEREFTGIDTFLQQNADKVLSRQAVQEAFNANRVQLAETRYGAGAQRQLTPEEWEPIQSKYKEVVDLAPTMSRQSRLEFAQQLLYGTPLARRGKIDSETIYLLALDMVENPDKLPGAFFQPAGSSPVFSQYTVPGMRSNYREVLLQQPGQEQFRYSAHWDEPNVMTHVRMSDRTIDGKKTLFVEELQDDWAQQARKPIGPKDPETGKQPTRGYRTVEQSREAAALAEQQQRETDELRGLRRQMNKAIDRASSARQQRLALEQQGAQPDAIADLRRQELEYTKQHVELQDQLDELSAQNLATTSRLRTIGMYSPQGPLSGLRPFKQTPEWSELGIKRAIDEAVRGGYDQVALVTGEQAADMFSLRKRVDSLQWRVGDDPEYGTLIGYKNGRQVLDEETPSYELDNYVGSELARELRFRAGESEDLVGQVSGEELSIGGKGMQKFYNEMLPNVIKDYSKKLGVPLNVRRLSGSTVEEMQQELERLKQVRAQLTDPAEIDAINLQVFSLRSKIDDAKAQKPLVGNLIIDITPQVREKILTEGQPLWAMGGDAGLALGGGLAGGTQGETEEERLSNALLLGGTLGGARVLRNLRAGKAVQHLVQDAADPMAQEFIALRNKTTRPGYLSPLAPEELVGKQVHLAHNGTVGFVLTRDGDLQNLFNNGGPRGAAREVIFDGIKAGGKTLDAFDGYLPKLYTQYGFVETGRLPFNDEYAPAGWNFERDGRPDVVFMAYRGMDDEAATRTRVNNPDMWVPREQTTRYFDDYDAAAQNNAAVATEFERARAAAAGTGAGRGSAVDAAGASVRAGGSGGVGGAVASVLGALRARPNNPPAVDRLLSLIDDPITYFRELGDDPAQLTRSLAEFRATTPVVRRLAQEAGDAPEQVDDVLTAARNLVEGRIDALARRTGPLAQMMEEIKGVKETTVEDAAKLAEQNTAQRLKEMRKRGPIDLSNATPAQRATRAMQLGMEDMREAIRRFGRDASEWYSKQGRQASAQMQAIIPELRGNPEKRFIADVILAITSSGATVEDNLSRAIPIIRQWLNTGEITQLDAAKGITPASEETLAPTGQLLKSGEPQMARIRSGIFREDLKGSTRAQAIETGLRKLQLFLDANGGDERAVRNFLLSEYKTKGTAARPSRTAPMSAEVMGPKIGRFLLNVQGMGDEVTVDSWATRTWMRWMGYGENARLEFDPEAKGMVLRGGPTPGEQPEIRNAFTKLAQSISKETGQDFTPADVQALLWYLEKFNYGKWGSTSDLVSFADVGDRFLMEGVPQPQQSNVAGTPYQFKFGTGETSGLDNATLRQYLGQFGREGKVYDIGGAFGEGVTALARTPEGRRLLGNVALGTTGYALTGDDDELLRNTGKGMMALALGSAVYPVLKAGVRQGAKGLAEQLQQTPRGRYALNLLSRDITTDPAVRKAVEDALAERSQITARFQELSRRARELGPEADRVVSDLLEGEAFAAREMAQMSPDDVATATALAQRIASQVRELGARKVEEDLISEQTFLKRAETYLPRLYARYDAEGLVDEVTATHRGKTFRITGEKIRNDALTPEERDALGEIREASYRLAEAGKRGAQDISTARLFRTLADMPGVIHPEFKAAKENELMAQLFAKQALKTGDRSAAREALRAAREARAEAKQLAETFTQPNYATQWLKQAAEGKGYVRLPDTPNMGQLRGAVVRADVADYLHDLPDLASAPGTYRDLLRTWKTIKTIYNVGTQVTNVLSNFAVVHAAGIPWWKQAARFRGAARDLTNYGPATKALTEAGVMGVNMPGFGDVPVKNVAADVSALRQLAETTRPETRQALAQEGIMPYGKLAKLGVKGRTKAQQYYAAGDGVFRVMLYQKYVKDGLTSDEAIQEVMRNMPSYDTRSPILGALRMGPAPFIMYPAKYLPTALDNIMMHPYRWATLAGTTWALMDQASRRLYGKIEEEDLPPNRRRSETFGYLLPGVTQIDALMRPALKAMGRTPDEERKYTIDAARFTPLSALTGSPVPGADLSSQLLGDRAPQILQPSGPLMDVAALAIGKNAYTGEDFFSPSDEPLDKALKLGGWAYRMATPTFLGVHTPRVIGDIRRGDLDAAFTNSLGILGMRPTMVTPGMQSQLQQRRFEEQMSDARLKLRQELRKARTPEEEARIEQKYEAKMNRLAAKYQQRLDEEEE